MCIVYMYIVDAGKLVTHKQCSMHVKNDIYSASYCWRHRDGQNSEEVDVTVEDIKEVNCSTMFNVHVHVHVLQMYMYST